MKINTYNRNMRKSVLILFSVICIFILGVVVLFNFVIFPKKYKNFIVEYSKAYDLDVALVYAIAKTESNFDEKAVSSSGAMGVMQIMPTTAKWLAGEFDEEYNESKLFEAEINIKYGCFYLRYLFDKFDDLWVVVAAYNAGETVVKNWLSDTGELDESKIAYAETKKYVAKVRGYFNVYKNKEIAI